MLALSRAKAIEMWPIDMLPLRWSVVYVVNVVDPFPEVLDDPLQSEQVFICHASIPITPVAGISIGFTLLVAAYSRRVIRHFATESLPALSQKYGFPRSKWPFSRAAWTAGLQIHRTRMEYFWHLDPRRRLAKEFSPIETPINWGSMLLIELHTRSIC